MHSSRTAGLSGYEVRRPTIRRSNDERVCRPRPAARTNAVRAAIAEHR